MLHITSIGKPIISSLAKFTSSKIQRQITELNRRKQFEIEDGQEV